MEKTWLGSLVGFVHITKMLMEKAKRAAARIRVMVGLEFE
jgi:hypothetical protein